MCINVPCYDHNTNFPIGGQGLGNSGDGGEVNNIEQLGGLTSHLKLNIQWVHICFEI